MPAIRQFAGMARSYKQLTRKVRYTKGARINHHAGFS